MKRILNENARASLPAVRANVKPLYYFAMDEVAGDKTGDGRGMVVARRNAVTSRMRL